MHNKKNPNILLVDDTPENLVLLEKYLTHVKANIIVATSGKEAILKAKDYELALALIDVMMPEMNGYELASKLLGNKKRELFPIIFITGYFNNENEIAKGYESGAVDYLYKPVKKTILVNKVNIFLEMYNQKQELKEIRFKLENQNRKLKVRENRFRMVSELSTDYSYEFKINLDNSFTPVWITDAFLKITGYTLAEVEAKGGWESIVHSGDLEITALREKNLFSGNDDVSEFRILTKNGQTFWLRDYAKPIFNKDKKITGIIGAAQDITKRKHIEGEIEKSQKQLRAFAAKIQQSGEEERKNIAREIHDEFGQVLTAIKMNLTILGNEVKISGKSHNVENIYKEIENMKKIIDNTIQSVREFSNKLRPDVLDTLGLVEALDIYIYEFDKLYNLKCNFIKPDDIEIDSGKSIAVYRIVQEALTNVARHARATLVNISLFKRDNFLIIEVEDDGVGISKKQLQKLNNFGIIGMKERTYISGGTLKIIGTPGKGTKVELTMPINKEND